MAIADTMPADLRELLQQTGLFTDVTDYGSPDQSANGLRKPLIIALIKSRVATEENCSRRWRRRCICRSTRVTDKEIDATARQKVPTKVVFQHNVMPMRQENARSSSRRMIRSISQCSKRSGWSPVPRATRAVHGSGHREGPEALLWRRRRDARRVVAEERARYRRDRDGYQGRLESGDRKNERRQVS